MTDEHIGIQRIRPIRIQPGGIMMRIAMRATIKFPHLPNQRMEIIQVTRFVSGSFTINSMSILIGPGNWL